MKKTVILILALILSISLAACGRKNKAPTSPATTVPTGETSVIPGLDPTIMDPTIHTNIPDPDVDTSMPSIIPDVTIPDFTDGSDPTANTRKEEHK